MEWQGVTMAIVFLLLLAGCTGTPTQSGTPETDGSVTKSTTITGGTVTPTTDATTMTTDGCPPLGNFSDRRLSDRPTNLTGESVTAFVVEYEENRTWNHLVKDDLISLGVHVSEISKVNETATGYIVHIEGEFGFERCQNDTHLAGSGPINATYFVNETALLKLRQPTNGTSDPQNRGTVVERWVNDTREG